MASSLCYDIEGNAAPCADVSAASGGGALDYVGGSVPSDVINVGNPVQSMAGASSGGSALTGLFSSILNFSSTAIRTFTGPQGTSSGLQYRVNPSTGQYGYFNPATGAWSVAPSGSGLSGLFSGSSSFILVLVAIVIGFLAFGKKRRS